MQPTATDLFIRNCLEFDRLMARLQAMRADHFNADAEAVHYGDVGSIAFANQKLREIVAHYSGVDVDDVAA